MTEPGSGSPAASIVLIVFNDQDRLPDAISSGRNQTVEDVEIIIVDHGSTDESLAVARAAAAEDHRIRVIALPDNDGKPGRPINAGMRAARAPWVTVFASDDVLRKRACEVMLAAADEYGADIVVGGLQRVDMETGETTRWMSDVTGRDRVLTNIAQLPELIRDTTGGGKFYNTEFVRRNGLSFPEDIYYQDQVFTLEYFAAASVVAIVSHYVLDWRHWPSGQSVTQRKITVENLSDRFTANERIDAFLSEHGRDDLMVLKQRKFLIHDLNIHVKGSTEAAADYRTALIERTRAYVAGFDPRALTGLPMTKHLMLNCLLAGRLADAEQVSNASYPRILAEWGRVESDGRSYVVPPWADMAEADPVFDVTAYRVNEVPVRYRPVRSQAIVTPTDSRFSFDIQVASHGRIDSALGGRGDLLLTQPATGIRMFIPLRRSGVGERSQARFRVDVKFKQLDHSFDPRHPVSVHAMFHRSELERWSVQPHPIDSAVDDPPASPGPWRVEFGANLTLVRDEMVLNPPGRFRRRSQPDQVHLPPDRTRIISIAQAQKYLEESELLPVKNHVFFESFAAKRIAEGPLAVSRRLRERRRRVQQYWSCTPWSLLDVPGYASAEPRFSLRYLQALAVSSIWIDNGWLPFAPRGGQRLIQLWHGVPIRRLTQPEEPVTWREAVSSGEYFDEHLREIVGHPQWITTGAPRTDRLIDSGSQQRREALRRAWGIADRTVLFYSPTLRDGDVSAEYRRPDLHRMAHELGPDWFWFHREHDDDVTGRRTGSIPEDLRWFAANASGRVEVSDHLLMSDILITDYASIAVDFALTGRPVIHYAPDRAFYEKESPGTYFSLLDRPAGPVVADDDALLAAVRAAAEQPGSAQGRDWALELAPLDAQLSTDALLDHLGF